MRDIKFKTLKVIAKLKTEGKEITLYSFKETNKSLRTLMQYKLYFLMQKEVDYLLEGYYIEAKTDETFSSAVYLKHNKVYYLAFLEDPSNVLESYSINKEIRQTNIQSRLIKYASIK